MAKIVVRKAFLENYWDSYIEKALTHKYIRKLPNGKGGWNYIYPKDFLRPLKALKAIFGLEEKKIDDSYEKNNIQAEYGATKKDFASHVLEYLSNRATWNKFFSDKFNRYKYKTPVKFEPKKSNLKEKVDNGEKKTQTTNEKKEKDFKKESSWNKTLMRKIYSMYNPVPEDKTSQNSQGTSNNQISYNGRVGNVTKDFGNGMVWVNFEDGGMGRFKKTDLQYLNQTIEETVAESEENADAQDVNQGNEVVVTSEETEQEKHDNRSEAMQGNQNARKDGVAVDVPKADDLYKIENDEKFRSITVRVKDGAKYYADGREEPDLKIYVSNQQEAEKVLKNLKKNSLEALQKKGLTAESVTSNIDYDFLITEAKKDLERLKQKVVDLRAEDEKHEKEQYKPISDAMNVVSNKHSEIRQQIEDLKKQYNRVRLADKKTEISLKISKLNKELESAAKELEIARKKWRDVFDESRRKGDEIRRIEDDDIRQQNRVITFIEKQKEAKGLAVKDLTDQEKLKKVYDMLHATTEGSYNNILWCNKDDFKVGDKLYYINPYHQTVQECVVKEVDSKSDDWGWTRGITFANKIGSGQRYDKTFMSYDMICSNMVRADGSMIGKPYDRSEKGITMPVFNNNEFQEHLNRSNAMLGNQNAAGEHDVDTPATTETTTETPVQTDEEMKKEQKEVKEARKKAGLPDVGINYGERVSAMEDAVSLNPNAENYAYKDTGYIAGSQKEKIQDFWKRKKESGEGTSIEEIDWNTLEENPRYAEQQITKANILGDVDYEAYKDKGMKPYVAYLISRVFAAIPKEPVGHSTESRKNYVIAINTLRSRLEDCKTVKEVREVVNDVYGEAEQTYDSQIARDPRVQEAAANLDVFRKKSNDLRIKVMEWARNELLPKYKEKGKKERTAIRNYKDDMQKELDAKIREQDPNFEGNVYFTYDPSDKWWPINIDNGKFFETEKTKLRNELKEVRKNAKEEAAKITSTSEVWKELGEKIIKLKYSNSFQTNAEKLAVYEKDRTTTLNDGRVTESFSYKYRDKTYDKYDGWSWLEKKKIVKEKSNIIEGRVKRRFEMIVPETLERVGGRDVTVKSTEELKKAFNFRDIQTGSYVQSDPASAKWHVDNIAAGFADLCDVLGIRDNQVSLNGRLALAVGARGHGKALAHYEPVERVINITKMKGGGSLGHEWFHSFDNMIAEAITGGNISVYMSNPDMQSKRVRLADAFKPNAYHDPIPDNETSQKVKEKFENLVKAMMEGDTPETEEVTYKAEDVEAAKKLFSTEYRSYSYYGDNFYSNLQKSKTLDEAISVINARYKGSIDLIRANSGKIQKMGKYEQKRLKETVRNYEKYRTLAVAYFDNQADKSNGGSVSVKTGNTVSRFFEDAKVLDGGKDKAYWSTPLEMAARSFEAYLVDKLAAMGRKNDYLSGHANNTEYGGVFYPYPTERDRVKINKAFDELFEVIRSENAIRKAIDILDNQVVLKAMNGRLYIKKHIKKA